MGITTINGDLLRKMIIAGANELSKNKKDIDALNVFPVPDGDTGTNMSLTLLAAAKEVYKLKSPTVYEVAKALSSGSLRGARGNSGVILSQLFRGFAKGLEGKNVINADDLAAAFVRGKETAYKAVMKPKEGTILTVASAIADKAVECAFISDDIGEIMAKVIEHANVVLKNTTNMLAPLKQANVVDAGGKGLLCIFDGAIESAHVVGEIEIQDFVSAPDEKAVSNAAAMSDENIEYGYCTELIVNLKRITDDLEQRFKGYLQTIGDSIVVAADDNLLKIHVHTENPGRVLEYAIKEGSLSSIKIENMREQHTTLIESIQQSGNAFDNAAGADTKLNFVGSDDYIEKVAGFIAVAAGSGLIKLFKELGADKVIEGGQTMNPSAEDILAAAESIDCENAIVLPNNRNIILAAQQAAQLCTDKNIIVVPTKTIPQGIVSLINYAPSGTLEENIEKMNDALSDIITGQVTYAVRDTVLNDTEIKEGDYLCLLDNNIEHVGSELQQAAKDLIDVMLEDEKEYVCIYYGADTKEEQANELESYISDKYPDCDIEVHYGGQPIYYYIISAE